MPRFSSFIIPRTATSRRWPKAVAEGAREARRRPSTSSACPELVPEEVAKARYFKLDQAAPVAKIEDLANYERSSSARDAVRPHVLADGEFPRPGRRPLGASGALHGKVGGAFTSTATQHGGQETTLFSIITNLLHFGMIIVGLRLRFRGPDDVER